MSYSDKIDSANANLKKAGLAAFDLSKISSSDKGYNPSDEMYETSAFLSYLGALIYSAYGDSSHASDMAMTLNNTHLADLLKEDVSIPQGKGRLDVIALTDLIGKRTEYSSELMNMGVIGDATVWFKIAYPVFAEQSHPIAVKSVSLSTGESKSFTLIEDFDKAVEMDVRSRQKGARNRSIARNVIKNSAAAVAGYAALESAQQALDKASNPIAQKAAVAGYDAAKIALNEGLKAVTDAEKADVRQGLFFPHKASAAGFTVGPGTYSVTVEYTDGTSDVIKDVVVSAGKPTIVVSENMKKSGI